MGLQMGESERDAESACTLFRNGYSVNGRDLLYADNAYFHAVAHARERAGISFYVAENIYLCHKAAFVVLRSGGGTVG